MTQTNLAAKGQRRGGLFWALVPVALLTSSVLGVGGMALVAVRDPNFATEADYYQKAVRWDHLQAQAATNQRLAFQIDLPARVALDAHGAASVQITLKDHDGRAMTGARVSAEAFANAYSATISALEFNEQAPGVYTAQLTTARPGLWEFRLSVVSEGRHFTAVLRSDLARGGAA